MKLSELAIRHSEIEVIKDGEFSSFGFCETKNVFGILVCIFREEYIDKPMQNSNVSCILTLDKYADYFIAKNYGVAVAKDPQKLFYEAHNQCVKDEVLYFTDKAKTIIAEDCIISPYAVIATNSVKIGKGCIIEAGAVINEHVTIGDYCVIGSNSIIGTRGFQFYRGDDEYLYMEHVGGVIIDNHVEIFSGVTIASGLIEPTRIHNHVKIDNLVHISHSDEIGEKTLIASGSSIAGSVHIGKNVWIGINSSVSNFVKIGNGAYLCIGSVVTHNVNENEKVSGNFAENHIERILRENKVRKQFRRKEK